METLETIAALPNDADVVAKGQALLSDERNIGGGIRLINLLSAKGRHVPAMELGTFLYVRRGRSRDLNVLLSAALRSHDAAAIREKLAIASTHEAKLNDDYDVQLVATWLRALYEIDDSGEFWRVHDKLCRESDRRTNTFVVVQRQRMLIRNGRYNDVITDTSALPADVGGDELVRKHLARAYIELGKLELAESALAGTREDHLRRSLVARINEARTKSGATAAEASKVVETPAVRASFAPADKPTVFIVYGHDPAVRASLENVLHRIGAEPWSFDLLPKEGSPTVIEILERYVPEADAVVALLTPDDEGRKRGTEDALAARARENVLLEAGYALISKRSRSLIVALGGVNIPSDIEGIHRIQAPTWSMEVAIRVAQRLRDMGFAVDPSRAV